MRLRPRPVRPALHKRAAQSFLLKLPFNHFVIASTTNPETPIPYPLFPISLFPPTAQLVSCFHLLCSLIRTIYFNKPPFSLANWIAGLWKLEIGKWKLLVSLHRQQPPLLVSYTCPGLSHCQYQFGGLKLLIFCSSDV